MCLNDGRSVSSNRQQCTLTSRYTSLLLPGLSPVFTRLPAVLLAPLASDYSGVVEVLQDPRDAFPAG